MKGSKQRLRRYERVRLHFQQTGFLKNVRIDNILFGINKGKSRV